MRKFLVLAALAAAVLGGLGGASGDPKKGVEVEDLRDASVLIVCADGSQGTGVLVKNGDTTLVWTAAHVVADTQHLEQVEDPVTKVVKTVATYDDVKVVTERHKDGRKVGEEAKGAKVVRYGVDDDVAVLLVADKNYGKKSVAFLSGVPKAGEPVWHVGCFAGRIGTNSVSEGVVAATGRLRKGFKPTEDADALAWDQISCIAHPGSSGGGVFLKSTGDCVGLVSHFLMVRNGYFSQGSFCIVPGRRVHEFAKRTDCQWALGPKTKVPDLKAIMAGRVTDPPIPDRVPVAPEPRSKSEK